MHSSLLPPMYVGMLADDPNNSVVISPVFPPTVHLAIENFRSGHDATIAWKCNDLRCVLTESVKRKEEEEETATTTTTTT